MNYVPSRLILGLLALALCVPAARATESSVERRKTPVVRAIEKVKASVVTIRVPRPQGGKDVIGTGVIVDERGIIVTNRHVVGNAAKVNVRLANDTDFNGVVLHSDPRFDLAIVRIKSSRSLPAMVLGPVSDAMLGETVVSVGHPFGYVNSVALGIISSLDREITMPTGDSIAGLIQHSTPINPGNSGGPLLNIEGDLIGINVALREGAQGIAFALNAAMVKTYLSQHLSALRVAGVEHGLSLKDKVVDNVHDRQRVVVATPTADLQQDDEIVAVGELRVSNSFDVERALWNSQPGETVALKVVRQNRIVQVSLTLTSGNVIGAVEPAPAVVRQIVSDSATVPVSSRR